jgi:thiol-disulfide isomerase/thioredoxin
MRFGPIKGFPVRFRLLVLFAFAACFSYLHAAAQNYAVSPPARDAIERGDQALASKKYSQAADKSLALAADDSARASAHHLRGSALFGQLRDEGKDLQPAEAEFRTAIHLDPANPVYHFDLATALLLEKRDSEGVRELQEYLKEEPAGAEASVARQWILQPGRARGEFPPDFHFVTAQGDAISPDALKGKIVVFDFWATWCPPCRAALPDLKDLVKIYPPDRFALISISIDDDEQKWKTYVEQKKMTWSQYHDAGHAVFKAFGLQVVPTYVVLGTDVSILDRITGTDPQKSVAYRLKALLAKRSELSR